MSRKIIVTALIIIISIIIFTIALPFLYSSIIYERNEAGETYGSLVVTHSVIEEYVKRPPDLIAVVATNGREGYVKKTDFISDSPRNPKEALEQQSSNADKTIPVYKTDGVTVIGEFEL